MKTYFDYIDSLRAIAVLLVLEYHAGLFFDTAGFFSAGFLGVDFFFLISGFVISHVVHGANNTKDTSTPALLGEFFVRRIKRLMPALLVVLILSSAIAYFTLLPRAYEDFSDSLLSVVGLFSNYYFFTYSDSYWAENSLSLPLLHTWSLSLEWHFYILFATTWIVLIRRDSKWANWVLLALSVLIASFFSGRFSESLEFYSIHARAWEFIAGALIYQYRNVLENYRIQTWVFEVVGLLSLAGVLLISTNGGGAHPGNITVIFIVCCSLLLFAIPSAKLLNHVLTQGFFKTLGRLSYSLYLIHWPVLVFGSHFQSFNPYYYVGVTVLASIALYTLVERPFRSRLSIWKVASLCLLAVIPVSYAVTVKTNHGIPGRFEMLANPDNYDGRYQNLADFDRCHRLRGDDRVRDDEFCVWGSGKKVVLVGDSHMASIAFNLKDAVVNSGHSFELMTRGGATFGSDNKDVKLVDSYRIPRLKQLKDSVVVIGGATHLQPPNYYVHASKAFHDVVTTLLNSGNKVVLIYPIPNTPLPRQEMGDRLKQNDWVIPEIKRERENFDERSKLPYSMLDSLEGDIIRIYPQQFLCDQEYCYASRNGEYLIVDQDHPSVAVAEWITNQISMRVIPQ